MTKRSYDPSRRKHAVPPQLRAWVYRRRKKGTHDPKRVSMATGYGTVGRKPYRRGARGGVAWSGGKTLRYDPSNRWGRAKAKARGMLGKVENNLTWVGLALGLLVPAEICRAKHSRNLYDFYVKSTIEEAKNLFGNPASTFTPLSYLKFKFLDTGSVWCVTFWSSLVAFIATKFGALKPISARVNNDIKKFSMGTLVASIFGALFIAGGSQTAASNPNSRGNPNANPANPPTIAYTYGVGK